MASVAPSSKRGSRQDEYSAFLAKGATVIQPDFGSVFCHVGPDALDLLHRLTTNSLLDLPIGSARRTVLTSEKGRIIDVFWVFRRSQDESILISDSPDPNLLIDGVERYTIIEDAELINTSDRFSRWYVFGPEGTCVLREVLPELALISEDVGTIQGAQVIEGGSVWALRTDTAGEVSWLIIADRLASAEIANRLADTGLPPASKALFDFVRVSNIVPIAGYELTESANPLEAKLMHLVDFEKGCYVGQEVIARLDTYEKVQRSLTVFLQIDVEHRDESIAPGDRVTAQGNGRNVGWITSVAKDPIDQEIRGLGYIRNAHLETGARLNTPNGAIVEVQAISRRTG